MQLQVRHIQMRRCTIDRNVHKLLDLGRQARPRPARPPGRLLALALALAPAASERHSRELRVCLEEIRIQPQYLIPRLVPVAPLSLKIPLQLPPPLIQAPISLSLPLPLSPS